MDAWTFEDSFQSFPQNEAEYEWADPKPLQRSQDSLPRLTSNEAKEMLPMPLYKYVADVSSRLSVGHEFVAAPLFSVLGGLIGRRVALRPKLLDSWVVYPCALWSCISAPPGSRKSPILGEVRRLADRLDDEAADEYVAARKNAEAKLHSLAQKRKAIEKNLLAAHEEGGQEQEVLRLETELITLQSDVERNTPKQKRYLTSDSTSAKLTELMVDNPGGLIVFRDELDGLIQSFEQMGNESLRNFYLEAWDGKGRITQDRVAAGTRRAKGVATTLLGSTQPDKLARIVSESDDGLIQRFGLLLCMPDQENEDRDEMPDIEAFESLTRFCKLVVKHSGEKPVEMSFSTEAREVFKKWQRENESSRRNNMNTPAMTSHLAKYATLFCGLSIVFQLTETFGIQGDLNVAEVERASAEKAEDWIAKIFKPHARFVYGKNVARAASEKLWSRIVAGQLANGMTVRALERKGWEGLASPTLVRYALEELEDLGWLKVERRKSGGGRPSDIVLLNPKLTAEVLNGLC